MASIGSASLAIIPSFKGFGTAVQAGTSREMAAAGATSGKQFSGGFKRALKLGGLAGGIAGALGVSSFIKDSINLEAEFGKTMAQIRVATAASTDELERLDDLAIKLGKDTVFSANEASTAMLELAKNGIKTATIESGALDSALTLAAAGSVGMEEAATSMGNALNAFQLKGKDAASVAAALAGAANASSASIQSLSEGLQQVSAVAADAGFTVQETSGTLAAFANAGIKGSDAGTSLKTFISRLMPATKAARDAFENFGLAGFQSSRSLEKLHKMGIKPVSKSLPDVSNAIREYVVRTGAANEGTMKLEEETQKILWSTGMVANAFVKANGEFKNMDDIAGILKDRLGGLSDSERAATLETLFGSDARRAATVLLREGESGIRDYIKATKDQEAAEKMAKANMEGTAGAIERLKGSWETAKLEFGKALAPAAADAMDYIAENVDTLGPRLAKGAEWITTDGVPMMKRFAGHAKTAAGHVGDMVGFLKDLPSAAKLGGLVALVGGVSALKMRGGGNGALGTAGKVLGLAKPVPVIVMNKGFGGTGLPGGGTTPKGGGTKVPPIIAPGEIAKGGKWAKFLKPLAGLPMLAPSLGGMRQMDPLLTDKQAAALDRSEANAKRATNFWLNHNEVIRDGTIPMVDATHQKFKDLFSMQKKVADNDPKIDLFLDGYGDIVAKLRKLEGDLNYIARPRYIRMTITRDFDTMGGRRQMGGIQEFDGAPTGGTTIHVGRVEAKDYDDFVSQMDMRRRRAALEGRRVG